MIGSRQILALAPAIVAGILLTAGADAADIGPQVSVTGGTVRGLTAAGIDAFKAIPFAAPPTGDLRWRAPQPVIPWSGVRDATHDGAECMQAPSPISAAPLRSGFSEDCLFVNVWRPEHAKRLPVMVWIHGGGFVYGGISPKNFDGRHLAEKGVVVVSLNYRLGRFGFFGFPALTREATGEPKGNYGYMDQIAALKWIQANIAAFGGDPGNVTIFGESAGGGSVHTLLTSPMAKGLFVKAIVESGGGRSLLTGTRMLSKDLQAVPSLETVGVKFAQKNGIVSTDASALAALRALPADKIVAGLNMVNREPETYGGPCIDGTLVVETPEDAYKAGREIRVPLMIGANNADLGYSSAKSLDEALAPYGETNRTKVLAAYDPEDSGDVRLIANRMASDLMMVEPARFVAVAFAGQGIPSYEFRFSYVAPSAAEKMRSGPMAKIIVNKGATHASEIPYAFDTIADVLGDQSVPADLAMARVMSSYWVNFAKTGNPNGAGLPVWPSYSVKADVLMNFMQDGPVAMPDPWKERLDLSAQRAENRK